jgi:predicted SprT family Zn-dependent metalloprotease
MAQETRQSAGDAYRPGDTVTFRYRGAMRSGTVARAARLSATVEADDGARIRVPFGLLARTEATGVPGKLAAVAALADQLLGQHGPAGWRFAFDHAKLRAGACHFGRRTISVALGYAQEADDGEIRDTLLHEIAHALVGRQHHHDAVWQAKARELGCSAKRCHTLTFAEPSLIARCARGCFAVGKHRRRRHMRCRRCGAAVLYEPVPGAGS